MKTSPELQKAVAEYQKGSVEAFNTLYEQSYKYLHTCVIHVVKNEDMAMDMLQETYLEISKSISQLKSTEDFLSWAAMIANRKCFAYLKKQKDILLDGSGLGEGDSDSADSITDYFENIADNEEFIPETVLQDREKQRLIKEIIDGLNDMQRLCVIGFYYNEQKQEEIAEELGIPVNTVKSHLNRAKAKIKEAVVELDVKKGTRLYSFAPFMALLFREEVQACVLRPMSKGLASAVGISAGVGSGALPGGLEAVKEFITENFGETLGEIFADTIGKAAIKVKALWAKFTAASIQTKAVVATTACAVTIGGAAVALTPEKEVVCTISKDTQEVLDQLIEISENGNYEEIYNIDYSNFKWEEMHVSEYGVYLNNNKIDTLDEVINKGEYWRTIALLDNKGEPIVNTVFYDGKHTKLLSDYTGYGMGIQGDSFTIGKFKNGKLEGKAVNIWLSDLLPRRGDDKVYQDYQVTEFNVELNEIVGDTVCNWFNGVQGCQRTYTGNTSWIDFGFEVWNKYNTEYDITEDNQWIHNERAGGQYYVYTGEVETMCKGIYRTSKNQENYTVYLDENGLFDSEKHNVQTWSFDIGNGVIQNEANLDVCYDEYGDAYCITMMCYYYSRGGYEFIIPIDIDYIK